MTGATTEVTTTAMMMTMMIVTAPGAANAMRGPARVSRAGAFCAACSHGARQPPLAVA